MLMPSIFGENLFNDDWMDFGFPEVDKALYGKHANNVMKTDVKETDTGYEVDIDLPGFKKDEINAQLDNGYLTISAAKGLDKDEKDAGELFLVVIAGQIHPAQEVIAGAILGFQLPMCGLHLGVDGLVFLFVDKTGEVLCIQNDTHSLRTSKHFAGHVALRGFILV